MVTNLCPNNGNAQWCPTVGSVRPPSLSPSHQGTLPRLTSIPCSGTNAYGYSYHFDIMAQSAVFGDNVVVDFEEVDCPSLASSDYSQCVCA